MRRAMQILLSHLRACTAVAVWVITGAASAADSPLAGLAVYPADVNLFTSRGRQSFVVQATYADGITRDVTSQASVSFADPALVRFDKHTVYPVRDGVTAMRVASGGQLVVVPVRVKGAAAD